MADWEDLVVRQSSDPTPSGPSVGTAPQNASFNDLVVRDPSSGSETTLERLGGYLTEPQGPAGLPKVASDFGKFSRSVLQGMSLGWADEMIAALEDLTGRQPYEEGYERQQKELETIPAAIDIPGQIAGAVASGGAVAKGAMTGAKGLSNLIGRGLSVGATEGALAGAGAGQPGERHETGVTGGILGLLVGAAAPAVATGGRKLVDRLTEAGGERAGIQEIKDLTEYQGLAPERVESTMRELGPTSTLADVSDYYAVQGREALRAPSPERARVLNQLETREAGRPGRLTSELSTNVTRTPDVSFDEKIDRVLRTQDDRSGPLFREATEAGPLMLTPNLERTINVGKIQSAIKEARSFHPDWTPAKVPDHDMRLLDRAYKSLNGKRAQAAASGNKDLAREYGELANNLADEIGDQVPTYTQALDIWHGNQNFIDAAYAGREVLSMDTRKIKETTQRLKGLQREYFNMGPVEGINDKLTSKATSTGDVNKFIKSEAVQSRLKAAFDDDEAYQDFLTALKREAQLIRSERIAQSNPALESGSEGTVDLARSALVDVAMGMPGIATARSLRRFATPASKRAEVNQILDTLYGFGPNQVRGLLEAPYPSAGQTGIGATTGLIGLGSEEGLLK